MIRDIPSLLWNTPGRMAKAMLSAGALALWFTAGAAMAWTVITCWFVWLFKDTLTSVQMFWVIVGAQGLTASSIAALAGREIAFAVGKGGLTLHSGRDVDDITTVTTETKVETSTATPAALPTPPGVAAEAAPWVR